MSIEGRQKSTYMPSIEDGVTRRDRGRSNTSRAAVDVALSEEDTDLEGIDIIESIPAQDDAPYDPISSRVSPLPGLGFGRAVFSSLSQGGGEPRPGVVSANSTDPKARDRAKHPTHRPRAPQGMQTWGHHAKDVDRTTKSLSWQCVGERRH